MATAKKITAAKKAPAAKKATIAAKAPVAKKAAAPAAKKAAVPAKKAAAPAAAKKAVASKTAAPVARKTAAASGPMKPIKTAFNKTSLVAHLADVAAVDPKAAKAVMAALEATMLASLHKKGLGEFTLPGLLKVSAVAVAAKKKRTGIDPFTKQERVFAAKPASVKVKVRSLKKLKDAAI